VVDADAPLGGDGGDLLFAFGGGVATQAAPSVAGRTIVPISGSQGYGGGGALTFTGVAVVDARTPLAGAPSTIQTTVTAVGVNAGTNRRCVATGTQSFQLLPAVGFATASYRFQPSPACRDLGGVTVGYTFTADMSGNVQVASATAGLSRALRALQIAQQFLGTPFVWGGSTPATGFDDAGLVQYAYEQVGVHLPRVWEDQFLVGTPIARNVLIPGDLVFFRDASGSIFHVGIAVDLDQFIHAPHTGDVVKVSSLDEPYYAGQFAGGRRVAD